MNLETTSRATHVAPSPSASDELSYAGFCRRVGASLRIHREGRQRSRPKGSQVLGWVLVSTLTFAGSAPIMAAEPVIVFDANYGTPVVHLDKLTPPLTDGLRAILAMYAMQAGAGCQDPVANKKLQCALNTVLKLGPQCSDAQLQLVGAWFTSVPKLSTDQSDRRQQSVDIRPAGSLQKLCLAAPDDGEGNTTRWARIKISQDGGTILVDAEEEEYAGDDAVIKSHYKTKYAIEGHSVTTLSHERNVVLREDLPH